LPGEFEEQRKKYPSRHEHGKDVSKLARGLRLISLVLNKLGLPHEENLALRVKKLAEKQCER
jgi:hypothetical protein